MGCVIPHQSNAVNIPHQNNPELKSDKNNSYFTWRSIYI